VVAFSNRDEAKATLLEAEKQLLEKQASLEEAKAKLGEPGDNNAQIRQAKSAVARARLNLEFTDVQALASGFVTNLELRPGPQTVANQSALALVDKSSYWIERYSGRSWVWRIRAGDPATVTLMSHPNTPLKGTVESIGWGIFQQTGSTSQNRLPNVEATFEWALLAQKSRSR